MRARHPKIPRRVSGYNLDELLPENGFRVARAPTGSEGTLLVTSAAIGLLAIGVARLLRRKLTASA